MTLIPPLRCYRAGVGLLTLILCALAGPAAAQERTDQLIVKFDNPAADGRLRAVGLTRQIGKSLSFVRQTGGGAFVYKLAAREELPQVVGYARALEALSGVRYAEADQLMQPTLAEPDDPLYASYQWHYSDPVGGINAPGAWAAFDPPPAAPVYVGVLDTGYRPHLDLAANLVGGADMIGDTLVANDGDGRDLDPSDPGDWVALNECYPGSPAYDSSWHGTHVSGTVAAVTGNGTGVAGVTYNMARVVPVRVLGKCGGYLSDIADGIRWAVGRSIPGMADNPTPVRVINMSLGGSGACGITYQNAIDTAVAAGASVVVAAGNSNTDASAFRPANCNNVVTVAATNIKGERAYYSNYGSVVEIAAPGGGNGGGIASTLNSGTQGPGSDNYALYQGTSMATPHVTAVAALLYLKDATLTPAAVTGLLTGTARAFPAGCSGCGGGIVDAGAAVAAVGSGVTPVSLPTAPVVTSVVDNMDGTGTLNWSDSDGETSYQLQRQKRNRHKWSGWSDIASPAADQTRYQDASGAGTFRYQLRAVNSTGSSDWAQSPELTVTDLTGGSGGGKPKTCHGKNC